MRYLRNVGSVVVDDAFQTPVQGMPRHGGDWSRKPLAPLGHFHMEIIWLSRASSTVIICAFMIGTCQKSALTISCVPERLSHDSLSQGSRVPSLLHLDHLKVVS